MQEYIEQNLNREIFLYMGFDTEVAPDSVCVLCEGSHGNNTQCQRND